MTLRPYALLLLAALAACGNGEDAAPNEAVSTASPASSQGDTIGPAEHPHRAEQIVSTGTVKGTVTDLQMGDYLWARIEVPGGEPVDAMLADAPLDLFIDAHRGEQLTVELATVRMHIPEAGGEQQVLRIRSARKGDLTAQSWWDVLSAPVRQEAQKRFEQGALSSGAG